MSHICFHSILILNIYKRKKQNKTLHCNSNLIHSLQGYYIQLGRAAEALEDELGTIIPLSPC